MSARSWMALEAMQLRIPGWLWKRCNCSVATMTLDLQVLHVHDRSAGEPLRWRTQVLVAARKQATSGEILLWMTPSEAPKALQASECSELLDPTGASCWIFAQR